LAPSANLWESHNHTRQADASNHPQNFPPSHFSPPFFHHHHHHCCCPPSPSPSPPLSSRCWGVGCLPLFPFRPSCHVRPSSACHSSAPLLVWPSCHHHHPCHSTCHPPPPCHHQPHTHSTLLHHGCLGTDDCCTDALQPPPAPPSPPPPPPLDQRSEHKVSLFSII